MRLNSWEIRHVMIFQILACSPFLSSRWVYMCVWCCIIIIAEWFWYFETHRWCCVGLCRYYTLLERKGAHHHHFSGAFLGEMYAHAHIPHSSLRRRDASLVAGADRLIIIEIWIPRALTDAPAACLNFVLIMWRKSCFSETHVKVL